MQTTDSKDLTKYKVFYGFARLTKKAVRKKSIVIQYANTANYNERQQRYIQQKMHIVHERFQTKEEASNSALYNRCWTKWEYFVDDKLWRGDVDSILDHNFLAEVNHVSLEERLLIQEKLKKEYRRYYDSQPLKRTGNGTFSKHG